MPEPNYAVAPAEGAFRFGRNWQRYIATHLNSERERIAGESLKDLLGVEIEGRSFLDIGSGSGIFSLCAYRAGARQVVSVDVDPEAIAATRLLRSRAGNPPNWQVVHRSILDDPLLADWQAADLVYSWGVLHHTGDLHRALRNATTLVAPGGLLAIAIYNRVTGRWLDSRRWLVIKRTYNRAPRPIQLAMELAFQLYWVLGRLRRGTNPLRAAREYQQSRGMAVRTDLVDWLGGYPYEYATAEEIVAFCEGGCGLTLQALRRTPQGGTGNNQFVFRRP